MEEHFVKYIHFQQFKCFQDFALEHFDRINLISGKNNIGKTAFMEGVELVVSSNSVLELASNINKLIKRRQGKRRDGDYELDIFNSVNTKTQLTVNHKEIEIAYTEEVEQVSEDISEESNLYLNFEPSLELSIDNITKIVPLERIFGRWPVHLNRNSSNVKQTNINFINSTTVDEMDIAIFYGKLIDLGMEDFLDNSLSFFDKDLIALKLKATENDIVLKVSLKNREYPILLSSLGEGINRYIAILSAIWASKDGYLFIDEIENGIHYSNYTKLWDIIFYASKKANCQLFITTHSKECITAFNRINMTESGGSFFEFYRNEKKETIIGKFRDEEQLEYALTHTGEIRGE